MRQNASEVVDVVENAFDEGTQSLARLMMVTGSSASPHAFYTSLLLLLRHAIEHADAANELLRNGIFAPIALHVRAILEAHIQMLDMMGEPARRMPHLSGAGSERPRVP